MERRDALTRLGGLVAGLATVSALPDLAEATPIRPAPRLNTDGEPFTRSTPHARDRLRFAHYCFEQHVREGHNDRFWQWLGRTDPTDQEIDSLVVTLRGIRDRHLVRLEYYRGAIRSSPDMRDWYQKKIEASVANQAREIDAVVFATLVTPQGHILDHWVLHHSHINWDRH